MVDYRPYPNAPHYIVGDDGSVWSNQYGRGGDCGRIKYIRDFPMKLKASFHGPAGNKYAKVGIYTNCKAKAKKTSVLVLETFVGPRPFRYVSAHKDGNREDNALGNLKWATTAENNEDTARHGHRLFGESHPNTKLTDAEVLDIRRRIKEGCHRKHLAEEYGVCRNTIGNVGRGDTFSHLNLPLIANPTA